MGQYHKVANLDKCEIIHPHVLGDGLKLWEQLASHPGTAAALVVLLASASNGKDGGDLKPHPMVGHWRGDRIAFVGDYDKKSKYATPKGKLSGADIYIAKDWRDISLEVAAVIEAELGGRFTGDGWRRWIDNDGDQLKSPVPLAPDMPIIRR